jgi:uncharacterized membrane protein YphA (DoxX/SURF4 family)
VNVFLWIVGGLLAALFATSGLEKLSKPKDKLTAKYPWMDDFSQGSVRFIGVVEVLGAIGLIVPAATGIAPVLTPIAAAGLAVFALLAAAMHNRRDEASGVRVTAILFVIAAFVASTRFGPYGW